MDEAKRDSPVPLSHRLHRHPRRARRLVAHAALDAKPPEREHVGAALSLDPATHVVLERALHTLKLVGTLPENGSVRISITGTPRE
jgi:hypothetical protein